MLAGMSALLSVLPSVQEMVVHSEYWWVLLSLGLVDWSGH
jgi:hypothetical protein